MAVLTFTRRQVVDMLPEFLNKRSGTLGPIADAFAKEAGVSRDILMGLANATLFREGDVVMRERYVWRSPYAIKRGIDKGWADAVAADLAAPIPGGWRMNSRAIDLSERWHRRFRQQIRSLAVHAGPTKRAADAAEHLASRIPASAGRSALTRKLVPAADEPLSDLSRLNVASYALWYFRDDCHIDAWEAQGYEGPAFNTLSYVWSSPPDVSWTKIGGNGTIDDLAKALESTQDRADVERNVDALVERGDLERDGDAIRLTAQGKRTRDAIEDDTDRRFFAIWDLDDAATARLGEDMRAVIDALPKAA